MRPSRLASTATAPAVRVLALARMHVPRAHQDRTSTMMDRVSRLVRQATLPTEASAASAPRHAAPATACPPTAPRARQVASTTTNASDRARLEPRPLATSVSHAPRPVLLASVRPQAAPHASRPLIATCMVRPAFLPALLATLRRPAISALHAPHHAPTALDPRRLALLASPAICFIRTRAMHRALPEPMHRRRPNARTARVRPTARPALDRPRPARPVSQAHSCTTATAGHLARQGTMPTRLCVSVSFACRPAAPATSRVRTAPAASLAMATLRRTTRAHPTVATPITWTTLVLAHPARQQPVAPTVLAVPRPAPPACPASSFTRAPAIRIAALPEQSHSMGKRARPALRLAPTALERPRPAQAVP